MDNLTRYMQLMAERDYVIREMNMALDEKKKALADRDIAILQRDSAISERNTVMLQREHVIARLQYLHRNISMSNTNFFTHGVTENNQHQNQHMNFMPQLAEAAYNPREVPFEDTFSNTETVSEPPKTKKVKQTKQKKDFPTRKSPNIPRKGKKKSKGTFLSTISWNNNNLEGGSDVKNDLELNQVIFDEISTVVPCCSCTGTLRSCYKWAKGGWQSSCCTNTISMYPLPPKGNKRHSRIGGRKMSGGVYSKLLSRLAAEGHDLSMPLDLKKHWAKHGTNRYITIK